MITLAKDCLIFHLSNGEAVPFSAEMISVELTGETAHWFGPEIASHAAKAVFHYFKVELRRQSVTAEEFAQAMEKVLRGFKLSAAKETRSKSERQVTESDLGQLAQEAGNGCELLFYPRLRKEFRQCVQQGRSVVRFCGLRSCVKQMTGARRWTARCRAVEEQIVGFLRECAEAETGRSEFALVVE
jgi:hypothetical protein